MIFVKVGQIWADNDSRGIKRNFRVMDLGAGFALVMNLRTNRKTRISLQRFKPTSNGYRLVHDVEQS